MPSTRRSVTASLALVAFLSGCSTTPQQPPKPAEPVRMPPPVGPVYVPAAPTPLMTPTTFSALPGWEQDDLRQAWPALLQSCRGLASKPDWKAVCVAARAMDGSDAAAVRGFFESRFVPNLVRAADGADTKRCCTVRASAPAPTRRRSTAYQATCSRSTWAACIRS